MWVKKIWDKDAALPDKAVECFKWSKQKAENPLPSVSTVAHAHLQILFEYTKMWPAHGALPSVRDIIAFCNTVPLDTTPTEVGQLTGMKFGRQGVKTNFGTVRSRSRGWTRLCTQSPFGRFAEN